MEDFDLNFGIKGDFAFTNVDAGTLGPAKNFNVIPNVGGGVYFSVTPKGEYQFGSASIYTPFFGLPLSTDIIRTNNGNYGFGITAGQYVMPLRLNTSINIPINHNENLSK